MARSLVRHDKTGRTAITLTAQGRAASVVFLMLAARWRKNVADRVRRGQRSPRDVHGHMRAPLWKHAAHRSPGGLFSGGRTVGHFLAGRAAPEHAGRRWGQRVHRPGGGQQDQDTQKVPHEPKPVAPRGFADLYECLQDGPLWRLYSIVLRPMLALLSKHKMMG